jgi:FkbM family methyltransferase
VGVCHCTAELIEVWPDCKHILFEPVAEFAIPIERHYQNIPHELHSVAVGDSSGTIGLRVSQVLPGMEISHSSMTDLIESSNSAIRTVPKVTLDKFLLERDLAEPYLLKIDIDGQELQVLRGAIEILKKCSIVIVECQSSQLAERIATVQSAGFTLFDLAEPCYYDKMFWQCDAIFIRKDIAVDKFKKLVGKVEPGMYEMFRKL